MESLADDHQKFVLKGKRNLKLAKHYHNAIAPVMFDVPVDQEKGIKGASILMMYQPFDMATGLPLDYMHFTLARVLKTMMDLWLLSTNSREIFYIGGDARKSEKEMGEIIESVLNTYVLTSPGSLDEDDAVVQQAKALLAHLLMHTDLRKCIRFRYGIDGRPQAKNYIIGAVMASITPISSVEEAVERPRKKNIVYFVRWYVQMNDNHGDGIWQAWKRLPSRVRVVEGGRGGCCAACQNDLRGAGAERRQEEWLKGGLDRFAPRRKDFYHHFL
ncbi:Hypp6866 [Branchiostoma lanceolatum]|uniref:Hypp6866 protein n=1 Tax=Branchiostoma lanceolatum TaxID=7740 RepID=A0A8J9YVP5_BRALA|nr:Hypp6866 [Branchiostoma lanceolatum]